LVLLALSISCCNRYRGFDVVFYFFIDLSWSLALVVPSAIATAGLAWDYIFYFHCPLCGAALTFFAAPKKVAKKGASHDSRLSVALEGPFHALRRSVKVFPRAGAAHIPDLVASGIAHS
jgi:hypothetical protein